ncbi:FUSC family protein [Albibacterium indicum]|uniref:FUSC family protein n=1 Tax=Albibacterium indicum TaxID=2292082 RepID=UPI000E49116F|nr:FUSC family membrane protein [Pedobacter indicus]
MIKKADFLHFLHGQDFANGLRISFGTIIPALVGFYFGDLGTGIAISLGALYASIADTPGPAAHRRNALLATLLLVFLMTLLTQFVNGHPILLVLELMVFCFLFSMLAAYGPRAAAVGTTAMLIIFLNIEPPDGGHNIIEYSAFITLGSGWYALLSLSLTQVMPYRLAQQELAETVREVATFIQIKSEFYDPTSDINNSYKKLIDQQIKINTHLHSLREILFKSKLIVKDPTPIGRTLILVFSDIIDLFEKAMSTQFNYDEIRGKFGDTEALKEIRFTLIRLSNELHNFGYFLAANSRPKMLFNLQSDLENLKEVIDNTTTNEDENTFFLKKVLINIRSISRRTQTLYTYFQSKEVDTQRNIGDISKFVSHDTIDLKIFRNNLTLKSDIFRHAIRTSVVMVVAFVLAYLSNFGQHINWILLTILVILKPGWSLTRERNFQRLVGTIVGGGVGIILLIWVKDPTARFFMLLVFMVLTYSIIRINYILGVIFMTPYLLIMFSFLGEGTVDVARERIFATFIGCGLAFISSYIILPSWEGEQIQKYMKKLLIANYNYFIKIPETLVNSELTETDYKLARKEVYVASANMASAYQRMITEPKSKQKNSKSLNKFIVVNHLFTSHTANLIDAVRSTDHSDISGRPVRNLKRTAVKMENLIGLFEDDRKDPFIPAEINLPENLLTDQVNTQEKTFLISQTRELRRITDDLRRSSDIVLGILPEHETAPAEEIKELVADHPPIIKN